MYQQFGDTLVVMHRTMSIRPLLYAVLIALAFLVRAEGFTITGARADEGSELLRTRFKETNCEWIPVPADVVIKGPNRNSAPVAWWYFVEGKLHIHCYAPGGGA